MVFIEFLYCNITGIVINPSWLEYSYFHMESSAMVFGFNIHPVPFWSRNHWRFSRCGGGQKRKCNNNSNKVRRKKAIKIISPFLYLPFVILIPFGIWLGIIPPLGIILILLGFWGYSISKILNKNLMYLHMHHKNTSSTCHTYIRPVYWLTLLSPIFFAAVYIVSTVL